MSEALIVLAALVALVLLVVDLMRGLPQRGGED